MTPSLRLFVYPEECYDEVVGIVKQKAKAEDHDIYLHVGLPVTFRELQEDEACRRMMAELLGKESYEYLEEPSGEVKSISLLDKFQVGETRTVQEGEIINVDSFNIPVACLHVICV